ncbi:MAG: hypothetical protein ACK49N_02005 [Verrucomicrobiota bacterium]
MGGTIGRDGMAFATDGRLHVAIYSGGALKVLAALSQDQFTSPLHKQ